MILRFVERLFIGSRVVIKKGYFKLKYGKQLSLGKHITFRKGFIINIAPGARLTIGDNCFFNNYCSINCHDHITIGKDNLFGEGVKIYDHNHVFNNKTIDKKKTFTQKALRIGHDNWIGTYSVILCNTQIGDYCVIAAGSTVACEVPSGMIYRNNKPKSHTLEKIIFRNEEA